MAEFQGRQPHQQIDNHIPVFLLYRYLLYSYCTDTTPTPHDKELNKDGEGNFNHLFLLTFLLKWEK